MKNADMPAMPIELIAVKIADALIAELEKSQ